MHPARAALAGSGGGIGTPPQAGQVRTADQMMEGGVDEIPPAKRQKIAKIPGTTIYPEDDWLNLHPVSMIHSWSLQLSDLSFSFF